jgi:hypothetical protein
LRDEQSAIFAAICPHYGVQTQIEAKIAGRCKWQELTDVIQ